MTKELQNFDLERIIFRSSKWLILCLISLVIFHAPIFCEEASPPEQVEITELSSDWWEAFDSDKGEELHKRIAGLLESVQSAVTGLSDGNKKRGEELLKSISFNFQDYEKIKNQPLPAPSPTPAIAASYTIEKLIDLNNQLQKKSIDLQAKSEARAGLQQQLSLLQSKLDTVRQKFEGAEVRSEDKILLALEKISLRAAKAVAKAKFDISSKSLVAETQRLNELQEEITAAKNRLVSTPNEVSQLQQEINPAKAVWEESRRQREAKGTEVARLYVEDSTEETKTQNQKFTLQFIEYSLKEVQAYNNFIKAELLYNLAYLLTQPSEINPDTLNKSMKDWRSLVTSFQSNTNKWFTQSEQIVRRSAELMSLGDTEGGEKFAQKKIALQNNVDLGQKNLSSIQGLKKEIDESVFLLDVVNAKSAAIEGGRAKWLRGIGDFFGDTITFIKEKLGQSLFEIRDHPVTILGVFQFFLIMFAAWWISTILTRTIDQFAKIRKGFRKAVVYRLNRLLHYIILVVGLLVALTSIGFDFSNLIIIAGALGVGLGFGLQTIFNNFISGIIILFQSHLRVGDYVELDENTRGEIREINVRSTLIMTNDGLEVVIPNSQMLSNKIINWTLRDPYRRVFVPFSVAYGSDIDQVAKVIIEMAKEQTSTLQKIGVPEPRVYLSKFGDNSLEMELVVWVSEKWTRRMRLTKSNYLWGIEKTLKKYGFVIPFPQRDIHIIGEEKGKKKSS